MTRTKSVNLNRQLAKRAGSSGVRVAGSIALGYGIAGLGAAAYGKRKQTIASRKSGQRLSAKQVQQRRNAARRPRRRGRRR